jgi:hypothetical protein
MTGKVAFKKADEELQIVWAEVYVPMIPDSHGDFMTAETIRDMAYSFMAEMALDAIDTEHNRQNNGSYIVESFLAREDDSIFIPGAWVIGVKVQDEDLWAKVKSGELNGFSIDGVGVQVDAEVEIDLPERITGKTDLGSDPDDPHEHSFTVQFDPEGNIVGGKTDTAEDGHFHLIKSGTTTQTTNGHNHRFSFIDDLKVSKVG